MPDNESAHEQHGTGTVVADDGQPPPGESAPTTVRETAPGLRRWGRRAAWAAAGALVIAAGFGSYAAAGGLSRPAPPPSAAIPFPPRANATFVEDDDLTAQDNQANILQSTAPGLVQVATPGGEVAGAGLVITPSGKVLTCAPGLRGARRVTVRFVMADAVFTARVIGTDQAAGLALLQLQGGGGRPFPTAAIGNSATFFASTSRAQIYSWHLGTNVTVTAVGSSAAGATLDVGDLTSLSTAATVGGQRISGLFRTSAQVVAGQETGGPLSDLAGQVIGIDVAGSGSGVHYTGYAIPINQALATARSIERTASHR